MLRLAVINAGDSQAAAATPGVAAAARRPRPSTASRRGSSGRATRSATPRSWFSNRAAGRKEKHHETREHPSQHFAASRRARRRRRAGDDARLVAWPRQTDISSTPIITTTAAQVKPNIMLLMDTSDSMARTHMPDEVETRHGLDQRRLQDRRSATRSTTTRPRPISLPEGRRRLPLPAARVRSAPLRRLRQLLHGSDAATSLNLNDRVRRLRRYDAASHRAGFARHAAAGLLLRLHRRPETLELRVGACTHLDTGATHAGLRRRPWTRSTSPPARQREQDQLRDLVLVLPDPDRPDQERREPGLHAAQRHHARRLHHGRAEGRARRRRRSTRPITCPIADFDAAQRRSSWFAKLFSQKPGGASPAREGLARVGRYYAGKDDGINTGMPATGATTRSSTRASRTSRS